MLLIAIQGATYCFAQNVQLHYDFGHAFYDELKDSRAKLTTTVEMFKPDKWGSTFFFVDMDYGDNEIKSAYWEISRELKFWETPVSIHAEYDGGLNYIKDSYLAGLTYTYNNKDFTKGFTLTPMYKYICDNVSPNNFQLTATWYMHFGNGKFSFSGFADFWREKHTDIDGNAHDFVFLAEPQFWVNFNKFRWADDNFNLSVGTEWEISSNFALMNGWYLNPTLAIKWSF
ncbi:MAG: DUF5020 family protein [Muribaculaceae bacterium]|nr:DUF5020 family protein [Muribaculaceae bacterium]